MQYTSPTIAIIAHPRMMKGKGMRHRGRNHAYSNIDRHQKHAHECAIIHITALISIQCHPHEKRQRETQCRKELKHIVHVIFKWRSAQDKKKVRKAYDEDRKESLCRFVGANHLHGACSQHLAQTNKFCVTKKSKSTIHADPVGWMNRMKLCAFSGKME